MSEKMFKEYVQSLLTVDGKGKSVKDASLKRLMLFACIMGMIVGFCVGRLI